MPVVAGGFELRCAVDDRALESFLRLVTVHKLRVRYRTEGDRAIDVAAPVADLEAVLGLDSGVRRECRCRVRQLVETDAAETGWNIARTDGLQPVVTRRAASDSQFRCE